MQSSYSVIKSPAVEVKENIDIKTSYTNGYKPQNIAMDTDEDVVRAKESLESMRKLILGSVNREKEEIVKTAYEKAEAIEKETYQKAYKEGLANGREDGYKEAYEENIKIAEQLIKDAKEILDNANIEYEKYLEAKKAEVIDFAYQVTEHILEKELKKEDGINDFVAKIFISSKSSKSFAIRCNPEQIESVKERINKEKLALGISTEVFFGADENITMGNASIQLGNGSVEVGIDNALESIKKEVF